MAVKTLVIISWIFCSCFYYATGRVVGVNFYNATEQFKDREALFGTSLTVDGIEGILAKAEPPLACQSIKDPAEVLINHPLYGNSTVNTFVLIERGNCSFVEKVLHAQAAKFDAAIIYNSWSDDLVTMTSPNSAVAFEIVIPSVFIGEISGYILEKFYLFDCPLQPRVRLYSNGHYYYLGHFFLPLCTILGTTSFCIIMYMVSKQLRERRQHRRNQLSQERLKRLPLKEYVKGDEIDLCAICLDDFIPGEKLRQLPCKHCYHCKCIDPWLTRAKRVCPLCKRRVLSDDESVCPDVPRGSEQSGLLQNAVAASPNAARFATGFHQQSPFSRSLSITPDVLTSDGESFVSVTEEDLSNISIGFGHFPKTISSQPCTSRLSPAERRIVYVQPVDGAKDNNEKPAVDNLEEASIETSRLSDEVSYNHCNLTPIDTP